MPSGSGENGNGGACRDTRIARIRTYRLMCPLPEAMLSSQVRQLRADALLVCVESAGGAIGWGECGGFPDLAEAALHSLLGPAALGRDALAPDALWHDLWRAAQPWGRRGATVAGLSGLDMAVWDLRGKLIGQSVSQMMGGALRDRVPCAATGLYFRELPETEHIPRLIEEAQTYAEMGFRAVRAQVGRNPTFDSSLARELRKALPTMPLHADAGGAYDLPEAVRMGRVLEEQNFTSFDEALSAEAPALYPQLSGHVTLPLAAGRVAQTRWGFQSMLSSGGISLAHVDPSFCGGISEALRIRAVAGGMGINIAPCGAGTQVNFAAALHLLATDFRQPGRIEPALGMLEREGAPNPLRDVIFSEPIDVDSGLARVPTTPGLGVTVDPAELRFFCIREAEVSG